jgi:hypothetical protein
MHSAHLFFMEAGHNGRRRKRLFWYGAAGIIGAALLLFIISAYISGMAGHSRSGPYPRIRTASDGDALVVTYDGVYDEKSWPFEKRLPEEERDITAFHFQVTPAGGVRMDQAFPAPGPGRDLAARFEHAATHGQDHVIVTVDHSNGSTTVVYDVLI